MTISELTKQLTLFVLICANISVEEGVLNNYPSFSK
jgi:hypothetical protein